MVGAQFDFRPSNLNNDRSATTSPMKNVSMMQKHIDASAVAIEISKYQSMVPTPRASHNDNDSLVNAKNRKSKSMHNAKEVFEKVGLKNQGINGINLTFAS